MLDQLVKLATIPADGNHEEARNAAMKACELLRDHPTLIARRASSQDGRSGHAAPERRTGAATIHPDAERLRDWRINVRRKGLSDTAAATDGICADCGIAFSKGARVIELPRDDMATHFDCRAWWWTYEPEDGGIPF
jgi:hypothetical protein